MVVHSKSKTHYRLPQPCHNLRYNTSRQIVLVGVKNLTIQLYPKALPEPVVPVPQQRLSDYEVWQVLVLRPQPCKANLLLPVSPVLV